MYATSFNILSSAFQFWSMWQTTLHDGSLKLTNVISNFNQRTLTEKNLNWSVQVQVLLAEITMVEEEIICLERKIEELKLHLYQEKQQAREWKLQQKQQQQGHFLCGLRSQREFQDFEQSPRPLANVEFRNQRRIRGKRASLGSFSEITRSNGKIIWKKLNFLCLYFACAKGLFWISIFLSRFNKKWLFLW